MQRQTQNKNKIKKRISELPKDIQIIIYEFNADHRNNMNTIFQYIQHMKFICDCCHKYMVKNVCRSKYYERMFCCSNQCLYILIYEPQWDYDEYTDTIFCIPVL